MATNSRRAAHVRACAPALVWRLLGDAAAYRACLTRRMHGKRDAYAAMRALAAIA